MWPDTPRPSVLLSGPGAHVRLKSFSDDEGRHRPPQLAAYLLRFQSNRDSERDRLYLQDHVGARVRACVRAQAPVCTCVHVCFQLRPVSHGFWPASDVRLSRLRLQTQGDLRGQGWDGRPEGAASRWVLRDIPKLASYTRTGRKAQNCSLTTQSSPGVWGGQRPYTLRGESHTPASNTSSSEPCPPRLSFLDHRCCHSDTGHGDSRELTVKSKQAA